MTGVTPQTVARAKLVMGRNDNGRFKKTAPLFLRHGHLGQHLARRQPKPPARRCIWHHNPRQIGEQIRQRHRQPCSPCADVINTPFAKVNTIPAFIPRNIVLFKKLHHIDRLFSNINLGAGVTIDKTSPIHGATAGGLNSLDFQHIAIYPRFKYFYVHPAPSARI